jgi:hypothetical protein
MPVGGCQVYGGDGVVADRKADERSECLGRRRLPEGSIGADHDRTRFIPGGDDLEQQVRITFVDGQIAQLIEEEKLRGDVLLEGYFQGAVDLRRGEHVDHVHDAGESHRDAFLTGGVAQRIQEMRLSRSGTPFLKRIPSRSEDPLGSPFRSEQPRPGGARRWKSCKKSASDRPGGVSRVAVGQSMPFRPRLRAILRPKEALRWVRTGLYTYSESRGVIGAI